MGLASLTACLAFPTTPPLGAPSPCLRQLRVELPPLFSPRHHQSQEEAPLPTKEREAGRNNWQDIIYIHTYIYIYIYIYICNSKEKEKAENEGE